MDYAEYDFRWLRKNVGIASEKDGYTHPKTVDVLQYRKRFLNRDLIEVGTTQWIDIRKEDENGQVCY